MHKDPDKKRPDDTPRPSVGDNLTERAAQQAVDKHFEDKVAFYKDERGPPSGIRLEPAVPQERSAGYWELATWEDGFWTNSTAPEAPKDVDMHQNIKLSCCQWEPIGGTQWRRYCTLTYMTRVVH
jgi:hypothetical protein